MSYNSLIATAVLDMPLQDDAASTVVVNNAGTDGTLVGGDNTADISTTGPTNWLPKALQLDGSADGIDITELSLADAFAVSCWMKRDTTNTLDLLLGQSGGPTNYAGLWNNTAQWRTRIASSSEYIHSHGVTTTELHHYCLERDASDNLRLFVDGVSVGTLAASASTLVFNRLFYNAGGNYFGGAVAGVTAHNTDGVAAELYAGPEPTYTSGATLASNGAYDVGTWTDPSNGTRTYEWVVVEADGTVVDSGTGATGTATFGSTTGLLTLLVRASNDGGYDVGDYATRTSGYGSSGDGYYEVATVAVPIVLPVSPVAYTATFNDATLTHTISARTIGRLDTIRRPLRVHTIRRPLKVHTISVD